MSTLRRLNLGRKGDYGLTMTLPAPGPVAEYRLGADVWLWLDPAQTCNIACEFCYTRPSHARRLLSLQDAAFYVSKLRDIAAEIREITLNWRGEPLMNRAFPQILSLVLEAWPCTRVQFHTNAMLLTDRVCEHLCAIERPFDVYLSIDGGNRTAHERNRGAGTFDRAVRGGLNLVHLRGPLRWPRITLYQLDLGVPEAEYDEDFLHLASRCDAWQRVMPIVKSGAEAPLAHLPSQAAGVASAALWETESDAELPSGACFWAGYSLCVAPDGDVSICILNQTSAPEGVLGNLKSETAEAILTRAVRFRRILETSGRSQVEHCARCHKVAGRPRPPRPVQDLGVRFRSGALRDLEPSKTGTEEAPA